MAKNKKSRAKYQPAAKPAPAASYAPLMLGSFKVPAFDGVSAVFGARINEYPERQSIPKVESQFEEVFNALFYHGGSLAEHGLKLKSGINRAAAMTAIKAWMCSFAPQHEHKTKTVAWALAEWCEPA